MKWKIKFMFQTTKQYGWYFHLTFSVFDQHAGKAATTHAATSIPFFGTQLKFRRSSSTALLEVLSG